MWTSAPSFAGSTAALDGTDTHAPSPSSSALRVRTALPSFQNSSGNPATKTASPTRAPLREEPRFEPQEMRSVFVTDMEVLFGVWKVRMVQMVRMVRMVQMVRMVRMVQMVRMVG